MSVQVREPPPVPPVASDSLDDASATDSATAPRPEMTVSVPTAHRPLARQRRRRRWPWLAAGLTIALLIGGAAALLQPAAPPPVAPATVGPRLHARGELKPARRANIGTLGGGVVESLAVADGQTVQEHQEIARVHGPAGVEVLTAPMRGTVTGTLVHDGDTVLPGAIVATVGDLNLLHVETDDVDEFLIGEVHPGQEVLLRVDALDGRQLRGLVRTVAPAPRLTAEGDEHYLTVIDVQGRVPDLRVGMTVRVDFPE